MNKFYRNKYLNNRIYKNIIDKIDLYNIKLYIRINNIVIFIFSGVLIYLIFNIFYYFKKIRINLLLDL